MSGVVFSLDIKIGNGVVKLPVLSSDSMLQVINRLAEISCTPAEKRGGVGAKLSEQLQHLLERGKISEKVRAKVLGLLGRKEEGEEEANRSSEAHFRILQESIDHAKKNNPRNHKKHYKYLQQQLGLNVKYLSGDVQELLPHYHHPNKSPSKSPKCLKTSLPNQDSSAFLKKYQALDRKCEQFITKNIKNNGLNMKKGPQSERKHSEQHEYLHHMRPSLPLPRGITPSVSDIDRKFIHLNIQTAKAAGERAEFAHFPHTQRLSPGLTPAPPFQPAERRAGKRYNYLKFEQ